MVVAEAMVAGASMLLLMLGTCKIPPTENYENYTSAVHGPPPPTSPPPAACSRVLMNQVHPVTDPRSGRDSAGRAIISQMICADAVSSLGSTSCFFVGCAISFGEPFQELLHFENLPTFWKFFECLRDRETAVCSVVAMDVLCVGAICRPFI